MAQKLITFAAVVCVLVAFVQSAPQLQGQRFQQQQFQPQQFQPQQFQPQQFRAQEPERQSRFLVVQDEFHQDPETKEYNFQQKFASGEQFNEEGKLKLVKNPEDGHEMKVIVTKGEYTIVEKDGSETLVRYTADETGFHPEVVTSAPKGK